MISCFSDSDDTDVCHCCMISNRSSPSHFTKDSPSNIFQVRTRPTTNNLCHCLENHKGYYLRNRCWKEGMLMLQYISGWLLCFRNVFMYVNNSQYTIYKMTGQKGCASWMRQARLCRSSFDSTVHLNPHRPRSALDVPGWDGSLARNMQTAPKVLF